MGAQACSQDTCCGNSNYPRPDDIPEYRSQPESAAHRELAEPAPPHAVGNMGSPSYDRYDRDCGEPAGQDHDHLAGGAGDTNAGESYFARELQELRQMPSDHSEGFRPKFTFRTGATYEGQWKGNMRHGFGVQTWVDGASFTGQWVESFAEGLGRFTHADGDLFHWPVGEKCSPGPRLLPP